MDSQSSLVQRAEQTLLAALRDGDEHAFADVVGRYHASLVRLARVYTRDAGLAEEVAQDTWIAVLRGIDRFEGRSSFRTWLFSILVNRARTARRREERRVDRTRPTLPPDRFRSAGDPWEGHWVNAPSPWPRDPESLVLDGELRQVMQDAIERLPVRQREVVVLRDVEGMDASRVADLLGVSEGNQRVLLHRGRVRVRQAIDDYFRRAETQ